MRRIGRVIVGLAFAVTCLAGVGPLRSPMHASAGSNGQELAFSPGCNSNWAHNSGHNQYGQSVSQWVWVAAAFPGQCWGSLVYDYNWWWKWSVRTDAYWSYGGGGYAGTVYTWVPVSQPYNWVVITMPGG